MYKIDNATSAAVPDAVPAAAAEQFWTAGNPIGPVPATVMDAWWFNMVQAELAGPVDAAGLAHDKTNNLQMIKALKRLFAGNTTTIAATGAITVDNCGLVLINAAAGSITITLPAANVLARAGYLFVRTDAVAANTVTITAAGADLIDGSAAFTIPEVSFREILSGGGASWYTKGQTPPSVAQCTASVTSATVVTLGPSAAGNKVFHPTLGLITIPAAGITALSTACYVNGVLGALGANTNYWVYLFSNAGVLALDFCTGQSSATRDALTGLPIKAGDNSRLLVFGVRTNGSSQFFNGAGLCGISNFWNRRKLFIAPGASTSSTTNTAATATGATNGCWVWSDEPVIYRITAGGYNATPADGIAIQPGIDGGVVASSTTWVSPTASALAAVMGASFTQPAEGYHTFTAFANAITGGTANYQISQTIEVNG